MEVLVDGHWMPPITAVVADWPWLGVAWQRLALLLIDAGLASLLSGWMVWRTVAPDVLPAAPGDLWQSDVMNGPFLPDPTPEQPDRMRATYCLVLLDDYSRRIVAGQFAWTADTALLEALLWQAIHRWGSTTEGLHGRPNLRQSAAGRDPGPPGHSPHSHPSVPALW